MSIRSALARRIITKSSKPRHLNLAMRVEGQVSESEAQMLYRLAQGVSDSLAIVELGSYRGRSTIALALGAKAGSRNRVFAVDPHERFAGILGGTYGPEDMDALYRNIVSAGVGELAAVVCLPSEAVARGWARSNVGLLWIDGDHRFEAVQKDLTSWVPHLSEDGIVALHDVHSDGVKRAISEFAERSALRKLGSVDSLAWFKVDRRESEANH